MTGRGFSGQSAEGIAGTRKTSSNFWVRLYGTKTTAP